jgi:hypothetical protein
MPKVSVICCGAIPVSFDFDIFSPPTSSQPWPNTCFGGWSPAAISIAGQITAWKRAMSLPTSCVAGQRRLKFSSSVPYPIAVM